MPTYAHYLRREGYETVLAGKMHFIGEQLHGYEERLTSDIYPGDFGWYVQKKRWRQGMMAGWSYDCDSSTSTTTFSPAHQLILFRAVNWDEPDRRLEWYHNASSILQAGPCIRSNQLDFDEEVMFKSTRYLYATARRPPSARPFCLTVSLTHPHDPYTIHKEYWDRYEGVDISMPEVNIPTEEQDAHSRRLLKVCGLLDEDVPDEAIKRARRAYFGAMSYVDDNVGKLLQVLQDCGMDENTIVIFSADHGDMLGERGLWYGKLHYNRALLPLEMARNANTARYKMSFYEGSARVPLMISDPRQIAPKVIYQNVSNIDILPTLVDLVNGSLDVRLPMDGNSLVPYLNGRAQGLPNYDTVYGEYCGEGTVAPLMMIKSGDWKLVVCPADPPQFFNVKCDPHELHNLATSSDSAVQEIFQHFMMTAKNRWSFDAIHSEVLKSQRTRRLCWDALKEGRFESWDYQPKEDAGKKYVINSSSNPDLRLSLLSQNRLITSYLANHSQSRYIRSNLPLDELELQARYPPVDSMGHEKSRGQAKGIAAAWGE